MKDGKPLPLRRQSQEGALETRSLCLGLITCGVGGGVEAQEESGFLTGMTEIMMLLFGMRSVTKRSDLGDR